MTTVWFVLIAGLWTGYFVLEGFDFGVGILAPLIGRDDAGRRTALSTIGPVWDGNEVWVITAAGASFAVFPDWYATLLSGLYLPLLLVLVALIGRGVALEYRGKREDPAWRRRWDAVLLAGSLIPAALWGLVLGTLRAGLPLSAAHVSRAGPLALLRPYPLLAAATTLALFVTHGAVFLALKTTGEIRGRAGRLAPRCAAVTLPVAVTFLLWTVLRAPRPGPLAVVFAVVAALAAAGTVLASRIRREGWAFVSTAATIAFATGTVFAALYPNLLPSTLAAGNGLTVTNAAAGPYTLKVMTWIAGFAAPLVLLYQGWTYWVFRRRVG